MKKRVEGLLKRLGDVEEALGSQEVFSDQKKYRDLSQEHSYLSTLREEWEKCQAYQKQLADNEDLLKKEVDPEFIQILQDDVNELKGKAERSLQKLENLLVPPNPKDSCNTILELRAGTGGEEAALFVADCVRMYKLFADSQGWRYEQLSCTPSDMGGFKEYVMVFSGSNVYRFLQYEGGTHRVQRVPDTEAQGRVHTSAVTIAALLEPEEGEEILIDEKDLKIDTYRSSGAGGQHVNTTDSAVRITHIPSGIVVACQEERSQHKNKAKALRILQAKLNEEEMIKKEKEMASDRASQVGSGDRSERIRTYNFPQNRLTDHRINLTLYNLDRIMNGAMLDVIEALVAHFHKKKLSGET